MEIVCPCGAVIGFFVECRECWLNCPKCNVPFRIPCIKPKAELSNEMKGWALVQSGVELLKVRQ